MDEGTNTPYVKKFTGSLGQDGWKAMNKHGKTKFFNNKESAHKHAGLPLNEGKIDEISTETLKRYIHKSKESEENSFWANAHTKSKKSEMNLKNRPKGRLAATERIMQREDINESITNTVIHKSDTHKITHHKQHYHGKDHVVYLVDTKNNSHWGFARTTHRTLSGAAKKAGIKVSDIKHPLVEDLNEVLGKENDIGTPTLTKKYKKMTPGQEKAQICEGLWIVSGQHQEQGHIRSKTYTAKSKDHAIKQFHDDHGEYNYSISKVKQLDKLKGESVELDEGKSFDERVRSHPAVHSVDDGGKGDYFVNLKQGYHYSGQRSFGNDSAREAHRILKHVKKGEIDESLTEVTRSPTITVRENGKEKKVKHADYHKDMQALMAGRMGIAAFKNKYK